MQVLLVLYSLEWLRTMVNLVQLRQEYGMLWAGLAIILGGVALFTALSAFVFRHLGLQKRYHKDK